MVDPEDKVEEGDDDQVLHQHETPLHGDVLESVLSHVHLIDLEPACHVSREWNRAVFSSLRNLNRIKPWLIVHTQDKTSPHATTTHAYDPRSHVWVEISKPPVKFLSSVIRSSHSTLLYTLTPYKLSFSIDPLNHTWQDLKGPPVWRTDPIVAVVGSLVVVAGGTCEFEDDALAVEMYDLKTRTWNTCKSMPTFFKDFASAKWLSVAANDHQLFITEKSSGTTYSFDTSTENWRGPYDLRVDPCMFFSTVGFVNNRLIMVGLIGESEDVKSVKMWEASGGGESLNCREIGEMPKTLVKKLIRDNNCRQIYSIGMSCAGNSVCIYNPSEPKEVVLCELGGGDGGVCRWSSVDNVAVNDEKVKFLFTSSKVEIHDIQRASSVGNWKFIVKSRG